MPDISMCVNYECPIRDKCYRYRAVPNPMRQSYSGFEFDEETQTCDYFSPIFSRNDSGLLPLRVCDSVAGRFMKMEG